jgi:hypothetical protein
MSHSTTGFPSGSQSPRRDVLLAMILASAASIGLCSAFALGFWVRGLIDRDARRPARVEQTPAAGAGQPAVAENPIGGPAQPAAVEAPLPAVASDVPPPAPTTGLPAAEAPPAAFVLHEPAPRALTPFILPEKPAFALADLKLDETAVGDNSEQVCAVDRSLNTALTWAKSPAAAAEKARQDGKLVFLIHVSGNFENAGFT